MIRGQAESGPGPGWQRVQDEGFRAWPIVEDRAVLELELEADQPKSAQSSV